MWVYGLELRSLGLAATAFSHWAMSLVLYMLCLKTLCCIAFVVEFISIWNHLVYIEHQEETIAPGSYVTFALWLVTFAHVSCMSPSLCPAVSLPHLKELRWDYSHVSALRLSDRMKAEMQIFTSVIQNVGNALVHGIEHRVPQSSKIWLKSVRSL